MNSVVKTDCYPIVLLDTVIGYWHHTVICLSICLSVCLSVYCGTQGCCSVGGSKLYLRVPEMGLPICYTFAVRCVVFDI